MGPPVHPKYYPMPEVPWCEMFEEFVKEPEEENV
jgi:hypothetical protein